MSTPAVTTPTAVRPFSVSIPEESVIDLRRRIKATRWPERETVADASQGVQLATMQKLVRYWGTEYDFRRFEARLNALPQFITEIDGLDIHFIHVKSPHKNALPLITTHGWPGSIIEMLNVVGPLSDPTAHGGDATFERSAAAFDNPDHVALGQAQPPAVAALRTYGHHRAGDVDDDVEWNFDDGFAGKYSHRTLEGIGHNVPQEAPTAFADAIIEVDGY